jgi:hypothetical protein
MTPIATESLTLRTAAGWHRQGKALAMVGRQTIANTDSEKSACIMDSVILSAAKDDKWGARIDPNPYEFRLPPSTPGDSQAQPAE